jgi:glycosyltransferase involved in cell wall biosynthesis
MKVLIISINEICYIPRLIKAADYFKSKGASITVFNPVIGFGLPETYKSFKDRKKDWTIIESDISKTTFRSKMKWLCSSLFQKLAAFMWENFKSEFGSNYVMNKALWRFPVELLKSHDMILINLVNHLPLAATLKKRNPKAVLIYDSQEYFRGQYENDRPGISSWVNFVEEKYIGLSDVVIATTEVMRKRLIADHNLQRPSYRLRNLPLKATLVGARPHRKNENVIHLIWHGFRVYFEGNRGINVMLNAVALCKCNFVFYIQGFVNETEKNKIISFASSKKMTDKIRFVSPADPEEIVQSLVNYDVGLIGEIPNEENQQLTSSNKLFEYIAAGLAVLAPNLPGLAETLDEFTIGLKYPAGDVTQFAQLIDKLAGDPLLLKQFQENAIMVANKELYWEHDFSPVYDRANEIYRQRLIS